MSWASRRRLVIICILFIFFGGITFLIAAPKIFKEPTCMDLKQNGDETGIDCGGTCVRVCEAEASDPTILWARAFPVSGSIYNAVAYIENTNNAAIENYPYEFRFYDSKGIFADRVSGTTTIPPLGRYAIVATGINAGNTTISRTTFQFASQHGPWKSVPEEITSLRLITSNVSLEGVDSVPKLTATLTNGSPTLSPTNVTVVAILYDKDDNAITASRTLIAEFPANSKKTIFFTWPKKLETEVIRYEIIPIIDVFHVE